MERTNYHTHTYRCGHASGNVCDYAKEAINKGLCQLGISDHFPFPKNPYDFRMKFCQLNDYLEEIATAKEELKGKLNILCGGEIEFDPLAEQSGYYEKIFSEFNVDYLVLGQHFFLDKNSSFQYTSNICSEELLIDYANTCAVAMKTGFFKIFAHPDIFCVNQFPWGYFHEKASDIIIQAAIDTGVILEFNANGIRRGKGIFANEERYPYPNKKFWEKAKNSSISAIIGSDAHEPNQVWDEAVLKSIKIMKQNGINRIEKIKF